MSENKDRIKKIPFPIPKEEIDALNKEMDKVRRDFIKKSHLSEKEASKIIITH